MSSPRHTKVKPVEVDLLIFDLDGTLVDTKKDIAVSANFALKKLGLPTLPEKIIHSYVGKGISNLMEGCLGEARKGELKDAVKLFRDHYGQHLAVHSRLFPGVREVLEHFADKKMAVLSNKIESFSSEILRLLGVRDYFDIVWGGDTGPSMKPHPHGIEQILNRLKARPERSVVVGDSTVDIETGKNAGVLTCAVTYGFDSRPKLKEASPDYLVPSLQALIKLFD